MATLMDQLVDSEPEDWKKNITVNFIGEDALDVGGPRREMFSLLFQDKSIICGDSFQLSAEFLQNKTYMQLGRAVGYAFMTGYPALHKFHPLLVKFILHNTIPTSEEIAANDISSEEVIKAIQGVCIKKGKKT